MTHTISMIIAGPMVQRTIFRPRGEVVSGMNHATVQRKIVVEIRNFIGLIHGLSPRIVRVSPIDTSTQTTNVSMNTAPIQKRSGSR